MSTTRLFLDWMYVHKGSMEATYDPVRISQEGYAAIERNKKMFGIHPDLSGHGMKRNRLPFGVKIAIEPARKSAPWLVEDKPWEKALNHLTIIHEEGKFRCWYSVIFPKPLGGENAEQTFQHGRQMDTGTLGLCYAESIDGVNWVKPDLGLFSYDGSKANNIVSIWQTPSSVFRDPAAPPTERYKAFIWDKLSDDPNRPDYGLFGAVSPDGLRWSRLPEPLIPEFCDTQNIAYWDEQKQKYVGYFRGHLGGRAIRYAETDNFRKWPSPEVIAHAAPLDHPSDDYYTNGFTRHPDEPSIKLIFNSVFHHNTDDLDVRLGVTHNGKVINWVSYDPVIPLGQPGEWDCGGVYVGPNMVRLPDGTLAVPYMGVEHTHGEYFSGFYGSDYDDGNIRYAWAIWDDGRIAGVEAEDHGEFWTTPEVCTGGPIEINARTSRVGRIEVELWEEHTWFVSKPIPGFGFEQCVPLSGDELWTPLRWNGKTDLSELKGKRIQLRVRMSSAKIFGYRLPAERNHE